MKHPDRTTASSSSKVMALSVLMLLASKASAVTFTNPYWPVSYGTVNFNWKIYSGSTFTGWVEPGEVEQVDDEVVVDDEDCGCPSEEYSDCWARPDGSSAQWQIW